MAKPLLEDLSVDNHGLCPCTYPEYHHLRSSPRRSHTPPGRVRHIIRQTLCCDVEPVCNFPSWFNLHEFVLAKLGNEPPPIAITYPCTLMAMFKDSIHIIPINVPAQWQHDVQDIVTLLL